MEDKYKIYDAIENTNMWSFNVEQNSIRPDELMSPDMYHFKVTIKHKKSGKSGIMWYSMGRGHSDFSEENIVSGLFAAIHHDWESYDYYGVEDVVESLVDDGYYDNPEQIKRIAKAIHKEMEQADRLYITDWFTDIIGTPMEEIIREN